MSSSILSKESIISKNTMQESTISKKALPVINEKQQDSLLALEENAKALLYFDSEVQTFRLYELRATLEGNYNNFFYVTNLAIDEISPYLQFKRRRSSILDRSFLMEDLGKRKKEELEPQITYALRPEVPEETSPFGNIFHPFFLSCFGKGISNILQKGEEIALTTIVFHDRVEPMYVFGTNQGRVLFFKLMFRETENIYYYYVINFGPNPINVLFNRRNMLFVSSEGGRLAVYPLNTKEWRKLHPEEEKTNSSLVAVDVTEKKKFEILLSSPLKKILKIKVLDYVDASSLDGDDSSLKESLKQHSSLVGLVLKNNGVICFDAAKLTVEFECRCNDSSVMGLFIHPLYDYLLILNANGVINIFSAYSGMYERSISIKEKDFSYALGVHELMDEYKKSHVDINSYQNYKSNSTKLYSSPVHTVLEYNARGIKNKIDYFGKVGEREGHKKFEVIRERLGDLSRLTFAAMDSPHLVWLFHYCNDSLFTTRYTRCGTVFLNLTLDQNYHIMMMDPKYSPEDDERRRTRGSSWKKSESEMSEKESHDIVMKDASQKQKKKSVEQQVDVGVALMAFVYPWGVDQEVEKDIKKVVNYNLPVFEVYHGVQGVGDAFSFLISEANENSSGPSKEISISKESSMIQSQQFNGYPKTSLQHWRTSEYLTTSQALSMMVNEYFLY